MWTDVYDLLVEQAGITPTDALEMLQDLADSPKEGQLKIMQLAEDNKLCPDCFRECEMIEYEQHHPWGDTYATEYIIELSCPEHGII